MVVFPGGWGCSYGPQQWRPLLLTLDYAGAWVHSTLLITWEGWAIQLIFGTCLKRHHVEANTRPGHFFSQIDLVFIIKVMLPCIELNIEPSHSELACHLKKKSCHFESGSFIATKKHTTDFEVLYIGIFYIHSLCFLGYLLVSLLKAHTPTKC